MISKRHITTRGRSVIPQKTPLITTIGMPTLIKRNIFKDATCNKGTCNITLG